MNWINILKSKNFKLENFKVRLVPLSEVYRKDLIDIALKDHTIWKYNPTMYVDNEQKFDEYYQKALQQFQQNTRIPLVVIDKNENKVCGCTSIYNYNEINSQFLIGYTWYGKEFQRKGVNQQAKFLLMKMGFENFNLKRIELHINEKNLPSRKSVEKYGAKLDGILRQNLRIYDNTFRDTAIYSVLDNEWPQNKKNLFPIYSELNFSLTH